MSLKQRCNAFQFLKMDNERNWRFREELAEQLERLIPLYSAAEVEEHLSPIAMTLIHDKVAAVRTTTARVLATLLAALSRSERPALASGLLARSADTLSREPLWVHRQTYAELCRRVYLTGAVGAGDFCRLALPDLLELAQDRVPNVRLAGARTLLAVCGDPSNTETPFRDPAVNPHSWRLAETELRLREDIDSDVRFVYGGEPDRRLLASAIVDDYDEDDGGCGDVQGEAPSSAEDIYSGVGVCITNRRYSAIDSANFIE